MQEGGIPSLASWQWCEAVCGVCGNLCDSWGRVRGDWCMALFVKEKGKKARGRMSVSISRNKDWRQVTSGNKLWWSIMTLLHQRGQENGQMSQKNGSDITAAGLEEYPASAKGRVKHVTGITSARNFPVISGPLRPTFPEVIHLLLGTSLPWCGCLSGAL